MLGKLEDSTLGAGVGQENFTEQLGQWWAMTQGQDSGEQRAKE